MDTKLQILLDAKNASDRAFAMFKRNVDGATRAWGIFKASLVGLAAGFSIDAVLDGLDRVVEHASDLNESMSKVNTLFGPSASAEIKRWADDSAAAMGLSTQAALDATGTMGNMFLQLGAGVKQSSDLSRSMVGLSSDLASFHNVAGGSTEVLLAMQSAFRGEYDALQRYIPTINAAAVQQQALGDTGKKSAKDLTNLEKALAAYKIIVRDAGAAVGDFKRTSFEYANTTRRLNAEWENFAATMGEKFLPAATKIKGITADILHNLNETAKGPSLEDQLKNAETLYGQLIQERDNKEEAFAKKRESREKRHQEMVENFIKRNQAPSQRESSKLLEQFQENQRAELLRLSSESPLDVQIEQQKKIIEGLKEKILLEKIDLDLQEAFDLTNISKEPTVAANGGKSEIDAQWEDFWLRQKEEYLDFKARMQDLRKEAIKSVDEALQDELGWWDEAAQNIGIDNALNEWFGDYDTTADKIKDKNQKLADDMKSAFAGWANHFSSTLNDMVWNAETSFDDILTSFGQMITQMLIQKSIIEPIVSSSSSFFADLFHGGGVVGQDRSASRSISATTFIGAPRLHDGLLSNEFPAILKRGESVLTPGQLAAVAGSKSQNIINIYDYSGDVDIQRQQTPAGETIDITLGRMIARQTTQYGTPMNKAMRRMGGRQQLILR